MGESCPRCGAANAQGWRFCASCGAPNPAVAGTIPPPSVAFSPPPSWSTPYHWQDTSKKVQRTKTGILLLLVGALLSWIPFISLIGGILTFVGVILVILGRKAFGAAHSRNVVVSIVLFIVGFVAAFVLGFILGFTLASAALPGGRPPTADAVTSAFNTFLWGIVIVTAATGVSSVLFTYALQKTPGRILLWAGYVATVVIQGAITLAVAPRLSQAVADAFRGGTYNPLPLLEISNQLTLLSVLTVVPAMLYAAANYLVWQRIERGEIPERPGPVPTPPYVPVPPPA